MGAILVYGASGYTGKLIAAHAVERGLDVILAGRNADKVRAVAEPLGCGWRALELSSQSLSTGLDGVSVVIHAAGPFSATSEPMAIQCIKSGVHYIDIAGEIDVFEALAAREAEGRAAGVTLLPGAGFDVVPSDCLLAHVASRLPGANRIRLSIGGFGGFSRGTAKTMVESVGLGTRVRRGGALVELAQAPTGSADFGSGPKPTIGVSWGDVATAWRSTGAADIEVFFEATPLIKRGATTPKLVKKLLATGVAQSFLKRQIDSRFPEGPTEDQRAIGRSLFLAEAWDAAGGYAASRMETAEAYQLTAWTAVEIARRIAAGDCATGYQTPATAFGADFILGFPGSKRIDL